MKIIYQRTPQELVTRTIHIGENLRGLRIIELIFERMNEVREVTYHADSAEWFQDLVNSFYR